MDSLVIPQFNSLDDLSDSTPKQELLELLLSHHVDLSEFNIFLDVFMKI